MIWVISGGNFGWKSAGISTWLQNLPLLIKVWQSRMQLRLLLFANNLLMFSGFLLISSWISTMSGFWNNTKIVSWLPPIPGRVFSSQLKLSMAPRIIEEQLIFLGTGTLFGLVKFIISFCSLWIRMKMIRKITSHFLFIDTEELQLGNMQSKKLFQHCKLAPDFNFSVLHSKSLAYRKLWSRPKSNPDIQTSIDWHILLLDHWFEWFQ